MYSMESPGVEVENVLDVDGVSVRLSELVLGPEVEVENVLDVEGVSVRRLPTPELGFDNVSGAADVEEIVEPAALTCPKSLSTCAAEWRQNGSLP